MQIKHKLNHSLFIFGLTILLFAAVCSLVQAQSLPNDIVFERSRDSNFNSPEIFTMKADGSNQTNLTNSATSNDYLPDWSPDGNRIAFVRSNGIWIMNADGSNRIQLTNAGDSRPSWSPNGGKIAFSRNSANGADIYVMNADGSNPVKLTAAVNGERSDAPRWSPDGMRITFFATRSQTGSDQEIYVMNADGTNQTALTNNTTLDVIPDWSPDNSKITFTAIRSGGNLDIYVMNADGSNQTRLTNSPAFDAESSWSPDGTKLVFETERDGNREIYTMNADGSDPVRLTNNTVPDESPRWKRNRAAIAPGNLDTTFGSGGKVVTRVTPDDDNVTRVRIQSDGKIVTLGYSAQFDGQFLDINGYFIVRHNADGTLDTSFGTNGLVLVSFGSAGGDETLNDFVILPDGRFLIAGSSRAGSNETTFVVNVALRRYLPNGARDNSFGTNGTVITTSDVDTEATKIVLQPDGKFVIAGFTFDPTEYFVDKVFVARYNSDGTLDSTFGTNGITKTMVGNNVANIREALVQTDGKILVAGQAFFDNGTDLFVLRYNINGTLDNGFGTGGIVQTDIDNQDNVVGGMVLQPDGKIVVNGINFTDTSGNFALMTSSIVRYNSNGSLDNTFGTGGIVRIAEPSPNSYGIGYALAIQQNGKILTAGMRDNTYAIARYNSNGTIDTSFGTDGIVITKFVDNPIFDRIYSLAVQPDGKIIAAGGVNDADVLYDVGLVRYLGDPVVQKPSDFDGDGRSDLSVFRPSNGTWYAGRSMQGFYTAQFGLPSDKPAPADYDGDGKTDIAVWRDTGANSDFAYFFILNSSNNTVRVEQFGRQGDVLTVGDWDGDSKADLAVYRATAGSPSYFYYRGSLNNPSGNDTALPWGTAGDKPLPGDYDGDRRMDAAVFRPSNTTWYIRNSSDSSPRYDYWGQASDTFVPADYDGDGKTDLAVFRNGIWYIKQSATNQPRYENWGLSSDKLVPADYDGDGKTDVAVFRDGAWFVRLSTGGIRYASFGSSSDVPIASVFVR